MIINIFFNCYMLQVIEDDDYNFGTNNRNTSKRYRPYLIKRMGITSCSIVELLIKI